MSNITNRQYYRGSWYQASHFKAAACAAYGCKESLIQTDGDLAVLVDAITKGDPDTYADFMVRLNDGATK